MNFYCFEPHGGEPQFTVAKAKGQISPAINATKPAHMHAAVLVYSSYLCGICCNDISLCQRLISGFLLNLITCSGHMDICVLGQQRGEGGRGGSGQICQEIICD